MAVYELSRNGATKYTIYSIDSTADLASLPTLEVGGMNGDGFAIPPCIQGSIAKCTNGDNYIIDGSNAWKKYSGAVSGGTGGGGTGGECDMEEITDAEIDDMMAK